jgi:hypothetical protein
MRREEPVIATFVVNVMHKLADCRIVCWAQALYQFFDQDGKLIANDNSQDQDEDDRNCFSSGIA